jgi:hypothetical protein
MVPPAVERGGATGNPDRAALRTKPGTYVLWLQLGTSLRLPVGGLGPVEFLAGHYAYVGGAGGPAGGPSPGHRVRSLGLPLPESSDLVQAAAVAAQIPCSLCSGYTRNPRHNPDLWLNSLIFCASRR